MFNDGLAAITATLPTKEHTKFKERGFATRINPSHYP